MTTERVLGGVTDVVTQALSHPYDDRERSDALRLATHMAVHGEAAHRRDCPDGHLTASVLLVDPDAMTTFLVLHPKMGRWMQLGGHVESCDASIRGAAMRSWTSSASSPTALPRSPQPRLDPKPPPDKGPAL